MAKLKATLGDALFTVEINFYESWPTNKWEDTPHFHIDNEIHILLNGSAVLEIGGKDVPINAGDICLLAPRSSHYPVSCSDTMEKANLWFSLSQNDTDVRRKNRFSEYDYYSSILGLVNQYVIVKDAELLSIVQKLVNEQFSKANKHIYEALLAVFFMTLAKCIKQQVLPYEEQNIRTGLESEHDFKQREAVEVFFQNRFNEEIGIGDLAKELCLSIPQSHRIVKKVFDEGFKKTLIKQRIEHACMLIKQQDLPLTEIAIRCGYTSYNGFLSAFKSYMGKTPKEYEKSIR